MDGIFDRITGRPLKQDGESTAEVVTDEALVGDHDSAQTDISPVDNVELHRTERRLREASQELLRFGLLEESQKPNHYRIASRELTALNAILEPLDLMAAVDDVRGLLFLKVLKTEVAEDEPDEEWSHPLVRKQRLTLEQSLLVAILRQYFIAHEQEAGTGAAQARVAVDELIPQMQVYLGEQGSEARERKRMFNLLDQLKDHGLVSEPDKNERVMIRPIIAHLANPENLQVLLDWLRQQPTGEGTSTDEEGRE
ncbi:DUF4194 domain-containing protein [Marinobacterium litorale]|uniref:DUF4194 domain-containing protein n=1 Tax=Marinobacterium litorale TaxID=404770 RepID=UPI00041C6CF7|nr:DUF4194 domain-containing protein [Marinobacterium litorale]